MSVVDVDTGEIIPAGALAKPDITRPGEPISLARITSQCRSIEVWSEHCDSIPDIQDARNKLAAIEQYVASTSKDGRALIAAAQRRLEIRIGILLGPAKVGANQHDEGSGATEGSDLTRHERSEFRKMADHPDIVEAVIDDSDDETPASRRRALDEINKARALKAQAEQDADEFKAMQPDGFDPALNKELIRQRGELTRLCQHLVDLGNPAEFLDRHDGHLRDSHIAAVLNAADYLARFADEIKERGLG